MIFNHRSSKTRGVLALLFLLAISSQANAQSVEGTNSAVIRQAFDDWKNGRGSVFDLLAEDAEWTVAGVSPVSAVYPTRQALVEEAVEPIHAQLATAITPEVKHIIAQGNNVVVLWDGTATARNGAPYNNSYAWHLVMEDGAITRVMAFLDTWALVELME